MWCACHVAVVAPDADNLGAIYSRVEADRISFSFSFSAPEKRVFLIFRYKYGPKITENSDCFNLADAWRAS